MKKLETIQARSILNQTHEQLFHGLPDIFNLQFDDEIIATTKQRTIWSWFLWEIHRRYPNTPLLKAHHIQSNHITPKSHIVILSRIKLDCAKIYNSDMRYGAMSELNTIIHNAFNQMYNVLTVELQAYVSGANAIDVLDILEHPQIKEANDKILHTPHISAPQIDEQQQKIASVLKTDKSLRYNSVAIAHEHDLVRRAQLIQCISARGFMPEINNQNFKVPMLQSYSTGMRTLTVYAEESRMASVSAWNQHTTMRAFQYVNRSLQILNGDIRNLHHVDCGTTTYTTMTADSMAKLRTYIGMYHMNNNRWEPIDINNPNLLNKPLHVRTIVDCRHPDRHGVCIKCFGDLSTGIVEGDKIGQFITAATQSKGSQNTLSTKHFSANSRDAKLELSEEGKNYFNIDINKHTHILVDADFANTNGKVTFLSAEVEMINNISNINETNIIDITRYSSITTVKVTTQSEVGTEDEFIDIGVGNKKASLTLDAIRYIKDNPELTGIDSDGNWVLFLERWDVTKAFFAVPRKKVDMVQQGKKIDVFLKGTAVRKSRLKELDTISAFGSDFAGACMRLQDLTIETSPVPMSHIQILIYGLMAADIEAWDFRLPNPTNRKSGIFSSYKTKVNMGNIATAMAYESQGNILMRPKSYTNHKRSPSDFEFFVMKEEEIKE